MLERRILQCTGCGLVFTEPDEGPRAAQYTEAYYRNGVYSDYLGGRSAIEQNAMGVLQHLATLTAGRRLLDVGCAAGFFLTAARRAGWRVRGMEVSSYMAEFARRELGLEVVEGAVDGPGAHLAPADVVTLWDTIEHLSHPALALTRIREALAPRGVLVVSTGDYGSLLRRVSGRRWRLFADPTHNFFFTEATLTKLLEKTGFRVLSLERSGKWVSLSMILHQSGLPFASRVRRAFESRGWNPRFYVNLRDVVTVHARPCE